MSEFGPGTVKSDWDVVARLLPLDWESRARELGAFRRTRGIAQPEALLRILLIHLAGGCSLKETALRAREAGLCSISSVALFKRLRASEQWLRWLAEQLWRMRSDVCAIAGRRTRVADATIVSEAGRTGSQWRVHYAIDLANLQCDFFELTDVRGGETFRRLPVQPGDVVLGDRGYARAPGIAHVVAAGGDLLVRLHVTSLPLWGARGQPWALPPLVRGLNVGDIGDWPARVKSPTGPIAGRLIAVKRSVAAAERVRVRLQRRAKHNKQTVAPDTLELAGYVLLWTTLPKEAHAARRMLEVYRWRWQIELAIKRMKSILGLGQLPKRTDASSRAWLHGKLFIALLLERLWHEAESLSPWGYPLEPPPKPPARNRLPPA